jgi:hypothetical protein
MNEKLQKKVADMLLTDGLYVATDTAAAPEAIVPLWVTRGKVYSLQLDQELDPSRFVDTATIHGPVFTDPTLPPTGPKPTAEEEQIARDFEKYVGTDDPGYASSVGDELAERIAAYRVRVVDLYQAAKPGPSATKGFAGDGPEDEGDK